MGRIEDLGLVADKGLEWKAKCEALTAERDQLRAEVERLRGEVADYIAGGKHWSAMYHACEPERSALATRAHNQREEINRLTARAEAADNELADVREALRRRHAAPLTGQTVADAVATALANGDSHYTALTSHVADLRGALEASLVYVQYFPASNAHDLATITAALACTPAQSLGRVKAEALRGLIAEADKQRDSIISTWGDVSAGDILGLAVEMADRLEAADAK